MGLIQAGIVFFIGTIIIEGIITINKHLKNYDTLHKYLTKIAGGTEKHIYLYMLLLSISVVLLFF